MRSLFFQRTVITCRPCQKKSVLLSSRIAAFPKEKTEFNWVFSGGNMKIVWNSYIKLDATKYQKKEFFYDLEDFPDVLDVSIKSEKISEFEEFFRSSLVFFKGFNKCKKMLAFRKWSSEITSRTLKPVFEINHSLIYCFNHSPLIDTSQHNFTTERIDSF